MKPSVSHFRVFKSVAYVHFLDEKRRKLVDKSENVIFIGQDINSKGYKLYNPNNGKTIISRDMDFDEEGKSDWSQLDKDYKFSPYFEEEEAGTKLTREDLPPHQQQLLTKTRHHHF